MKTITLDATTARNQFFDLLKAAYYGGQVTKVMNKKTNEILATISPAKKEGTDLKALEKAFQNAHGVFSEKDFEQIEQARTSFDRKLEW